MRDLHRLWYETPLVSLEGGHCQARVWPPAPELSILQYPEKAPILPLWKVRPGQNAEVWEQGSELTMPWESTRGLQTIIYCNAFSPAICYSDRVNIDTAVVAVSAIGQSDRLQPLSRVRCTSQQRRQ